MSLHQFSLENCCVSVRIVSLSQFSESGSVAIFGGVGVIFEILFSNSLVFGLL